MTLAMELALAALALSADDIVVLADYMAGLPVQNLINLLPKSVIEQDG